MIVSPQVGDGRDPAWPVEASSADVLDRPVRHPLLHPIALLSLVVLVVNDHWLKGVAVEHAWLRPVTGKLSDVVGLIVFPLTVVTLAESIDRVTTGRRTGRAGPCRSGGSIVGRVDADSFRRRVLVVAVTATGVVFAGVQLSADAAILYESVLEVLRSAPSVLTAALGGPDTRDVDIAHVMDPTDLWCLPSVAVCFVVAGSRTGTRAGRAARRGRRGPRWRRDG